MTERAMTDLAARLGHTFADPVLLVEATTHRSWSAENRGTPSNERLAFLGDAALGLATLCVGGGQGGAVVVERS